MFKIDAIVSVPRELNIFLITPQLANTSFDDIALAFYKFLNVFPSQMNSQFT